MVVPETGQARPVFVAPIPAGVSLGRIDAGQDLDRPQHFWVVALGDGVCFKFDPPGTRPWGGLGAAYFTLDHHLKQSGRLYERWYSAECGHYVVRVGERVQAGQRIAFTSSGWTETGFYAGQDMNSQVPTLPGEDFHALLLRFRAGKPV